MSEHLCRGIWKPGTAEACPRDREEVTSISPYDDHRTNTVEYGRARSGQVSSQGTTEHKEYWSGRVAGTARPGPVNVKVTNLPFFQERMKLTKRGTVILDGRELSQEELGVWLSTKLSGSNGNSISPSSNGRSSKRRLRVPITRT